MKYTPVLASLVLAISLASCTSTPKAEPLGSKDLGGLSLTEAKDKLDAANVRYDVKVVGYPGMTIPEDADNWETAGLLEPEDRPLRSGESVTLYVKPKVWPSEATPSSTPTPTPEKRTLTYVVKADGPIESVTYGMDIGTRNSEEKVSAPGSSFTKDFSLTAQEMADRTSFSIHAWPGAGTTTISCQILVDGDELDSSTLTGSSSVVSCLKMKF